MAIAARCQVVEEGDSGSPPGGCRMRRCDRVGPVGAAGGGGCGFCAQAGFIARFLEFGTKPHRSGCAPKAREEALYFNGVWRRQVNHQRQRKQPWDRPGFEAATGGSDGYGGRGDEGFAGVTTGG